MRHAMLGLLLTVSSLALAAAGDDESLHLLHDVEPIEAGAVAKSSGKAVVGSNDFGNIAGIALEGPYDRGLIAPRQEIAQRFYSRHADEFDFLIAFTTFEFPTGEALAFYQGVRNDVDGIGLPRFDHSAQFGSAGRLQGYIDMAALSRYDFNTRDAGFRSPLNTLTHELLHRWAVRLNYQDAQGARRPDLLGRDGAHWSLFAGTDASIMYGARWQQTAPDRYAITEARQRLGWWDLYLAGWASPEEVPELMLVRSGAASASDLPRVGLSVQGSHENIAISQVIAAEGERQPSAMQAQRHFDAALLLVARPGENIEPRDLARLERFRVAYEQYFQSITGGRATLRLHLRSLPGAPIAGPAPLAASEISPRPQPVNAALDWLRAQQRSDGRWEDRAGTAVRDTVAAVMVLAEADPQSSALASARQWLQSRSARNQDEHGWLQAALPAANVPGAATLNADGGLGIVAHWNSSPIDALRAFDGRSAAHANSDTEITRLIGFLRDQQNADGSFPAVSAGPGRIGASALAAARLLSRESAAERDAGDRARDWLDALLDETSVGADAYSLAEVAEVTLLAGPLDLPTAKRGLLAQHLFARQGEDGDWGGSVYTTAVAALALQRASRPNLVPVAAVASPAQPVRGESVRLRLRIANRGGLPAAATTLHWYDADPAAGGVLLGDAIAVRALLAGDEVVIDHVVSTGTWNGARTLHAVLDQDDAIEETIEDDNALALALNVQSPPDGIDLAVDARDLVLDPPRFDRVPSTVTLSGRVRNLGLQPASDVLVRALDQRGAQATPLGEVRIDLPATGDTTFQLALPIARAEAHTLRVVLDPDAAIAEARENNNSADISLPFGDSVDLEVLADSLEAGPTAILGEDATVRVTLANRGTRDAAATTVVLERDAGGGDWEPVAEAALTLRAAQQAQRSLVWRPADLGPQSLRVRVDPADVVAEVDETNNVLGFAQDVIRNDAPSLAAVAGSIRLDPETVLQGAPLRVVATVRNLGTSAAAAFDAAVYRGDPRNGGVLLGSTRVSGGLAAQAELDAQIDIADYAEQGDATLFVHFDATGEIPEGNESDNYGIREITALSLGDLAISASSIVLAPVAPVPGSPVLAQVTVSNLGEQPSAVASVQLFELAGGERREIGATRSLPSIAPGQTHVLEWDWNFGELAGARAVSVQIDRDNLVRESDESNNEAALLLDVQDGEAFVTEPYFSPNGDGVRDQTRAVFAGATAAVEMLVLDHSGRERRRIEQLEPGGNGAVSAVWDGRDQRGRVLVDGRYALLARTASGAVFGPAYATLDNDRPMALEAVNSEDGVFRELPVSVNAWMEMPEGTPGEDYVFALGSFSNVFPSMQRGVLRSHVLMGGVEPVISARWLDRYAQQHGLMSIEPTQLMVLRDGRLMIAMDELGGENRGLIFVQGAADVDRPELVATLIQRTYQPLVRQIDATRFLVSDGGTSQVSMLDLRDGSLQPIRYPNWDAGIEVMDVLPEGVLFGAGGGYDGTMLWMFSPFDTAMPERYLDSSNSWGQNERLHYLPGAGVLLLHLRANRCESGGEGPAKDYIGGPQFEEDENEAVYVIDVRAGGWQRIHGTETFSPSVGSSCTQPAKTFANAGERIGEAPFLSLRAFWLEHEREAVVIDHAAQQLLRFDPQGRALGSTALPDGLRTGEYQFESGDYAPVYGSRRGENPNGGYGNHPSLHASWRADASSRIGLERRYYDADAGALYLTTGEFVYGYSWYHGDVGGDGAVDYLRVARDGSSTRLAGRTAWPLRTPADQQNYPRVSSDNAEQMRPPADWPRFIHRNGTMLRRDGRVHMPTLGRISAPWRHASRLLDASPSQTRLQLFDENGEPEVTTALFSTLHRLTAVLVASSDGRAVTLSGIAADRNFDHFQIDWAHVATPDDWNVLVPATRDAVRFDDFYTWAPPQAGAYLFRLRVSDRAGNARERFASAEVSIGSPIANVRQNFRAISPNADGVQDALELRYLVLRPTEQRFSIRNAAGQVVFSQDFSFGNGDLGPGQWIWDGRDQGGVRVPDGRYRAELSSGFGLRVNVDVVAPRISAALTQPYHHFDLPTALSAALSGVPLTRVGPRIDYDVVETFAGQPVAPSHQALESAAQQATDWTEMSPFFSLGFAAAPDQALLSANQFVDRRFRVVAADAAGNRTEVAAGEAEPLLLFAHGQRVRNVFAAFQERPWGRVDDIPRYSHPLINEPDVPLIALDLAGGLEELSADELVVAADGSRQWVTRGVGAPQPELPRGMTFADDRFSSIPFDLSGREPGSLISLRLRGRFGDGSERISNALEFEVGGLLIGCKLKDLFFKATSYLEEPSRDFRLEVRRPGGSGWEIVGSMRGDYDPVSRTASYDSATAGAMINAIPGSRSNLEFRVTAIDGQEERRHSLWNPCTSLDGSGDPRGTVVIWPAFSAQCSALPSNRVLAVWTTEDAQKRHRLRLTNPFNAQSREVGLDAMEAEVDVTGLAEGTWTATLQRERDTDEWVDVASGSFPVDRTPSQLEIDSPVPGDRICAAQDDAPQFSGEARDERSMAFVLMQRPADSSGPFGFIQGDGALGRNGQMYKGTVYRTGSVRPLFGNSPMDFLASLRSVDRDERVELRATSTDWSGAQVCQTLQVDLDAAVRMEERAPPRTSGLPGVRWPAIAPEGAVPYDVARWFLRARERVDLVVTLHPAVAVGQSGSATISGDELATLQGPTSRLGDIDFAWDGRLGATPAPDGLYGIRFTATDDCGNELVLDRFVVVDATPPDITLDRPEENEALRVVTVSMVGSASDAHFERYSLAISQVGDAGPWEVVADESHPAPTSRPLAQWPTNGATGPLWIRLQAHDLLGNRSTLIRRIDLLEREEVLRSARIEPWLFSPNGDGNLDEAEVALELRRDARLTVRVLHAVDGEVRRLADDEAVPAGVLSLAWDGRDAGGAVRADGDYLIEVRAVDASQPDNVDVQPLDARIDTVAPTLDAIAPDDDFVRCDEVAGFGVDDLHLRDHRATLQGPEGVHRHEGTLPGSVVVAEFENLAEGGYQLAIEAGDLAGNLAEAERTTTLDCTLPAAVLAFDSVTTVPRLDAHTIRIMGRAQDENFSRYRLELAPLSSPTAFELLHESAVAVDEGELLRWQPTQPDGEYVLRLWVEDAAGNTADAQVEVVIDGTPPRAEITSPLEGEVMNSEIVASGYATDDNFAGYRVEIATLEQAAREEWSLLEEQEYEVHGWHLARTSLAIDSPMRLRLTVRDRAGLESTDEIGFRIDAIPPPPLVLSGTLHERRDVRLDWIPPAIDDLDGVRVLRDGAQVALVTDGSNGYLDRDVPEGELRYVVVATDIAGNVGPESNTVVIDVDRTPPDVALFAPQPGERVRANYVISGLAQSLDDDFAEWELALRIEDETQVLRRSPAQVPGGSLHTWNTRTFASETAVRLRLSARDLVGNEASVEVPVVVDNEPPAAPTGLVAVDGTQVQVDWDANTEPDLLGYLLYRGGQLVGFGGSLPADLRPLALADNHYPDVDAPDGEITYRVYAIDQAGNISLPSAPAELDRDAGPPDLDIVRPQPEQEFEQPLEILARSDDRDIAQVVFAYRAAGASAWTDLGAPVTQLPWIGTFDPDGLDYGDYELRALATDEGGRVDPEPPVVTVRYADLTPPTAPQGVRARADAAIVRVSWSAVADDDLDGYRVERREWDGRWLALTPSPIDATEYFDPDRGNGAHDYRVLALDASGNVSEPSVEDRAHVFTLYLDAPATPTSAEHLVLNGRSGERGGAIAYRVSSGSSSANGTAGEVEPHAELTVPDLALFAGDNTIEVRITDTDGNISLPATRKVRRGLVPLPPEDLQGTLDGNAVSLAWDASPSTDVAGYRVFRNGRALWLDAPLVQDVVADDGSTLPPEPVDGDPQTAWTIAASLASPELESPRNLSLEWPTSALIAGVRLQFADAARAASAYRIYALSEYGDLQLLASRTARQGAEQRVLFDTPYPAATLLIAFERAQAPGAEVALAEVEPLQRTLEASTDAEDTVGDGHHVYEVSAVSALGYESARSTPWSVDVGDAEAPPAVVLSGSVDGDAAQLQWSESVAPDLHGYAVLRDGERIGEVAAGQPRTFIDPALANGQYVYIVLAEDEHFNASAPSNAVTLDVALDAPPAPRIDSVAQDGEQAALRVRWSMPAGALAARYRLYASNSENDPDDPYALLLSLEADQYLHQGLENEVEYWYRVQAIDARGNAGPMSEPRGARVRDTRTPLTPRLTWPTQPGRVLYWSEPQFAVCGRTSAGASVSLHLNQQPAATVQANPSWSSRSLLFAQQPLLTLLAADGRSVFMPGEGFDTRPGWFDLQTGTRVEPDERFAAPLQQVRATRDGRVVVSSDQWGTLRRFERDVFWNGDPESFGSRIDDFAIDQEHGYRLLVLGERIAPETGLYLWRDWSTGYEPLSLPAGRSVREGSLSWQGGRALFADTDGRVYAVDANNGGDPVQIGAGADAGGPIPSPRGRSWIALQASPARVLRIDADGGAPQVLLEDGRLPLAVAWSPDAELLALSFPDRLEIRDAANGAVIESSPWFPLEPTARVQLQWSASWRLLLTSDGAMRPQAIDVPGAFCRDGLSAVPDSNVIEAIARNGSGIASAVSEPIELMYDPSDPNGEIDLVLDPALGLFPSVAHLGESRTLFARIRNESGESVRIDGRYLRARLTLPDGSERILDVDGGLQLFDFEQRNVTLALGEMTLPGEYALRVELDPEERLAERDEGNNLATTQWQVREDDLPYLSLASVQTTYAPGEPIEGETFVFNPGPRFDGEVVLHALDADGNEIAQIARREIDALAPAQGRRFDWGWDVPEGLLAGDYRIRATLFDALDVPIDTRQISVTLAGEAEFGLVLQPQRSSAPLGQALPVQVGVDYLGGNRVFEQGTLRLFARSGDGAEVLLWQGSTGALLPGYRLRRSVNWSAAQQVAGINTLRLSFQSADVAHLIEREVELLAAPVDDALRGTLSVQPGSRLVLGAPAGTLSLGILHPGSTPIVGGEARVRIVQEGASTVSQLRSWPLDLAAGATFSQQLPLDEFAATPRAYAAVLEARLPADPVGQWRALATLGLQTVDGEAPTMTLITPEAVAPRRAPAPLAVRIVDRHSRVLDAHYRVDGGEWRALSAGGVDGFEALLHGLPDGAHVLDLRSRDLWDNEAQSSGHAFVIDSTPPVITIDGVEAATTYTTAPTAAISIQDAHPDGFEAWLDGRPYVSGTPITADGSHRIEVIARDLAGNRSDRSIEFRIDRTAPSIVILSPVDGSTTELDAIQVLVQSEAAAQLHLQRGAVTRDLVADAQGRASFDAVPLDPGANLIRVTARDQAGNTSAPASVQVTRSQVVGELGGTLRPAMVSVPRGQELALDIDLVNASSTAFDDLPLRLRALAADSSVLLQETIPVDIGAGQSLTLPRTLPSSGWSWGPVTLLLEADTGTGLRLLDSAAIEIIDADAPLLQPLAPLAGSVQRPPLALAAQASDARGVVAVEYRLDGDAWSALPLQSGEDYAIQVSLDDGSHLVRYRARDAAGNQAESADIAFVVDATAPQIVIEGIAAGEIYTAAVTPLVSVIDANPQSLVLTLDGAPYVSGTAVTQHGAHRLRAIALDAAGNGSEREVDFTLDLIAPEVVFLQPQADEIVATESVLVIGQTEAGASVQLETGAFEVTVVANAKGVFSVADVPLEVGANLITARATDAVGNAGALASLRVFRSEDGVIGLRGTISADPVRVPTGTDAHLEFGVVESAGVARAALPLRVEVRAVGGGSALVTRERSVALAAGASLEGEEFVSSAGFALGDYVATLSAQHQGNWTVLASATYEVADVSAPLVAFVAPSEGSVHGETAAVAVQATDDGGVAMVELRVDGGAWQSMGAAGADRWQLTPTLPREGKLVLEARARDAHDNTSAIATRMIRSDRTPPQITITGVSDGQLSRVALVPVVSIEDASQVQSTLRLDGATFVSGTTVGANGVHVLTVEAVDEVGQQSSRSLTFEIDDVAPTLTLTYPPAGTHVSVAAIDVLGTTEPLAMVELAAPGASRQVQADASGGFVFAAVPLVSGDNLIRARATDAAGNVGSWVSTSVLRACGTSELGCPIFGDGFERMHRDGFEARNGRASSKSSPPPEPDVPPDPRPRGIALPATPARASHVPTHSQLAVNP